MELQCADLWKRFHDIGTEMIITKAGRLARTHAYTRTELELAIFLQLSGGFMAQDMRKLCVKAMCELLREKKFYFSCLRRRNVFTIVSILGYLLKK